LEELLELGAVSQAEVEVARARLASLEPRLAAAKGGAAGNLAIRAPFDGRVAEVHITSGGAVSAGDPLVRLVRTPPIWIEAAVAPSDVTRLHQNPTGLVLEAPGGEPVVVDRGLRLVSVSPEIDRATGTVTVILEIAQSIAYPLGSLVTAEILLPEKTPGVVVPAGAIVDDAGVPVVYVQVEGESFERREITVVARQGSSAVVDGIREDERIVVRGGAAIRRASLLSSGEVEGHVH
jgi:RND family efflux transporter MFP subunit